MKNITLILCSKVGIEEVVLRVSYQLICVFLDNVMATLKLDIPLFDRRMILSLYQCTILKFMEDL